MIYHPHQFFAQNDKGRDFVVGDLHGELIALEQKLQDVSFDKEKDRVFAVGDMVDRGKDSLGVLKLLDEDWFFSVLGNHEDMMMHALRDGIMVDLWEDNGGDWHKNHNTSDVLPWIKVLEQLPVAISIQTENGLVGITHAEPPEDWLTAINNSDSFRNVFLWSRYKIMGVDTRICENVHKTYHGHTPGDTIRQLGNSYFIDTNRYYNGNISLVRIN